MSFWPSPIRAGILSDRHAAVEKVDDQLLPLEFREALGARVR
jgi:hypothetical protein